MDEDRDRLMRDAIAGQPRQILAEFVHNVRENSDILRKFVHGALQSIRRRFVGHSVGSRRW